MYEDRIVELHSTQCTCSGSGMYIKDAGAAGTASRCHPESTLPAKAVRVAAARWRDLGMPRNVEQYELAVYEAFRRALRFAAGAEARVPATAPAGAGAAQAR